MTAAAQSVPASPPRLSMTSGDWLLLIVLSLLWGGAFSVAKLAVVEIPPLTLALGRVGIAAVILGAIVWVSRLPLRHAWSEYAVQGLFQNIIPFSLLFWGQLHISSALASILIATVPLFTVVVAHVGTVDDKLTGARAIGLLAGFVGVVLLIGPDALGDVGVNLWAQIACLGAAVSYACGGVYGRRFRHEQPITVAAGQLTASSVMLVPLVALVDRPWELAMPSATAWWSLIVLAVLSTAVAYLIYFRILGRAGATNVMLVSFLMPVSAIVIGVAFLAETITVLHLVGLAAIAVGLAAIDGRPWTWTRRALGI